MSQPTPLITDSAIQAAKWLKEGQLLAYPTESVWGIGCDPYDQAAVQRILDIKQRPQAKGMIVVTDSVSRLPPLLASLDDVQRQQVIDSWQTDDSRDEQHNRQAHTWLLPIPQPLASTVPLGLPVSIRLLLFELSRILQFVSFASRWSVSRIHLVYWFLQAATDQDKRLLAPLKPPMLISKSKLVICRVIL